MSKCKKIKEIIVELFDDGEVHTIGEVIEQAMKQGVITDSRDSSVKNALYQMKKTNASFINVDTGKYQMEKINEEGDQEKAEGFDSNLDCVLREVTLLKKFDWVNCSDEELAEARAKIVKLKRLFEELQRIMR